MILSRFFRLREGKDLAFVKEKALSVGAIKSYMIDVQEEFANEYALMAMQAHTLYEGKYLSFRRYLVHLSQRN